MLTTIQTFNSDDRGATAIEYGLMASMIAMVILVALSATGNGVMAKWNDVMDKIVAAFRGNSGEGEGDGG